MDRKEEILKEIEMLTKQREGITERHKQGYEPIAQYDSYLQELNAVDEEIRKLCLEFAKLCESWN